MTFSAHSWNETSKKEKKKKKITKSFLLPDISSQDKGSGERWNDTHFSVDGWETDRQEGRPVDRPWWRQIFQLAPLAECSESESQRWRILLLLPHLRGNTADYYTCVWYSTCIQLFHVTRAFVCHLLQAGCITEATLNIQWNTWSYLRRRQKWSYGCEMHFHLRQELSLNVSLTFPKTPVSLISAILASFSMLTNNKHSREHVAMLILALS